MSTLPISHRRRARQGGSAILEFGVVAPFLILTFFSSVGLGIMMGRYIQAVQVGRDLAHMYVDGIDFTQTGPQNIAVQLASGTGMTAAGGNGEVIFSRIMEVYQVDCNAAGIASCTNLGLEVFTQRLTVGNSSLMTSKFGTPTSTLMDSEGNISASVYLGNTDSSVRTTLISSLLTAAGETGIPQGNYIYATEVFFTYPDLSFLGMTGIAGDSTVSGAYARFLF